MALLRRVSNVSSRTTSSLRWVGTAAPPSSQRVQLQAFVPGDLIPIVCHGASKSLGLCSSLLDAASVRERLKYHSHCLWLFEHAAVSVEKTSSSFVVRVPDNSQLLPVSLLHSPTGQFVELSKCMSVTREGQVLSTRAWTSRPAAGQAASHVIDDLVTHQALSFLKGLDVKLACKQDEHWMHVHDAVPDAPITAIGLVVPEDSVKMATLYLDNTAIECVLRQDAGMSLADAVKKGCDWSFWPAVSTCSNELAQTSYGYVCFAGVWSLA
jgi:hypothetical protein